jgi:hypothetical protein
MPHPAVDESLTLTATLEQLSPFWAWVRANFSLPAVLTIAGVIASAGSYIISLKTRVVVLEHEVVHITRIVPDSAALAGLRQEVADHEERIGRLEKNWDDARELAGMPPRPLKRKGR